MNKLSKTAVAFAGGLGSLVLASCGGGGGTATPTYNAPIAQPSLPGTVVQILQANGAGGFSPLPANSDGSYNITDQTAVMVNAQTTQGLSQSLNWGFAATDGNGLNYAQNTTTKAFQVAGTTDPILQLIGYSGLATVPSSIGNPTNGTPLQFSSLIAPGGTLVLGLSQGLTPASASFQSQTVFRVLSAYTGTWSVSYGGSGLTFAGTCQISIAQSGVVSGSCSDPTLGSYAVTGRDYGTGNAMGVQFQSQNGVINFYLGTSPVASNLLQGRTNLFVDTVTTTQSNNSTSSGSIGSGTSGSSSSGSSGSVSSGVVTRIYAQDPYACQLIPGAQYVQIANPTVCASSNQILFSSNSSGTTTTATSGTSGIATSETITSGVSSGTTTSGQSGSTGVPVMWTATRTS